MFTFPPFYISQTEAIWLPLSTSLEASSLSDEFPQHTTTHSIETYKRHRISTVRTYSVYIVITTHIILIYLNDIVFGEITFESLQYTRESPFTTSYISIPPKIHSS